MASFWRMGTYGCESDTRSISPLLSSNLLRAYAFRLTSFDAASAPSSSLTDSYSVSSRFPLLSNEALEPDMFLATA